MEFSPDEQSALATLAASIDLCFQKGELVAGVDTVRGCGDCVLPLLLCNSGFEGFTSFAKIVGITLFA